MNKNELIKTNKVTDKFKKIGDKIYKYRYYIAIVVFILCVLFEISGSSIGKWKDFIQAGEINEGVIFGKSRGIRSDEWAVLTPMIFSQKFDGFNYFSNIVRGGNTDVFILYGTPILNIVQIFKPFQIGYLFLGLAKGLSFFWCGRIIALFMISFEFGMILTNKKKTLSLIYAFLITLSPMVQWWFAVCGVAELFIFGQLALILLYKYMNNNNFKMRCLYLLGLLISAGGYILIMYPAWQIPMFYVLFALAIAMIIKNRKNCKISKKDIIAILTTILLLVISLSYIITQSYDTIKTVMQTVYPGSRFEKGGEEQSRFCQYIINVFLPVKEEGLPYNTCTAATMFSLFPMGIILSFITIFKEKKKDTYLIAMLLVYAFFSIWVIFGFPAFISKITLMYVSKVKRGIIALGTVEILLLIRSLSLIEKPITKKISITLSIIISLILVIICKNNFPTYITSYKMIFAMLIMCIYLFYFILRYKAKYAKGFLAAGIIFVMVMSGFTVNPIRKGVDVIYESEIIKKVQEINNDENGKWITEGIGFPIANYILMAGVPTINCTNTYPDLEKWGQFDNGKYQDVYNRYSHINIKMVNSESEYEDKFRLIQSDWFEVYLLPEELQKLDVKYIFTVDKLEEFNTENIEFYEIYNYNNYKIYRVNYI